MKLDTENINLFQLMAALLLTPCSCSCYCICSLCSSFQIYLIVIAATLPRIAGLLCATANFRN